MQDPHARVVDPADAAQRVGLRADDLDPLHGGAGLLGVAGQVAGNTAHIPQLQATAPVLGQIVDEAVVQDGYMNALTDGYGGVPA